MDIDGVTPAKDRVAPLEQNGDQMIASTGAACSAHGLGVQTAILNVQDNAMKPQDLVNPSISQENLWKSMTSKAQMMKHWKAYEDALEPPYKDLAAVPRTDLAPCSTAST